MDILLQNVTKTYGSNLVLDRLTLRIPGRGITALLGPSGCGKTTLLRLLAGLEEPDSGEICGLAGARLSFVFQENRLVESLSLLTNLRFVCSPPASQEEILEALQTFQLEKAAHQPVSSISGGMKRRVAILRAFLVPFDWLLLDEPFKELDDALKHHLMLWAKEKLGQRPALLVTHDPREADALGGHKIYLQDKILG